MGQTAGLGDRCSSELHFNVVLCADTTKIRNVVFGTEVPANDLTVSEQVSCVGDTTCGFESGNDAQMAEVGRCERLGALVEAFERFDHGYHYTREVLVEAERDVVAEPRRTGRIHSNKDVAALTHDGRCKVGCVGATGSLLTDRRCVFAVDHDAVGTGS